MVAKRRLAFCTDRGRCFAVSCPPLRLWTPLFIGCRLQSGRGRDVRRLGECDPDVRTASLRSLYESIA
jgi:hypothetical protein